MKRTIDMVEEFHTKLGVPKYDAPTYPPVTRALLRERLLQEELAEFIAAVRIGDLLGVLDALCDLQYVLDGTFLEFGMQHIKDLAFAEVHRSNMTKYDTPPKLRADGKILKSANYEPPRLEKFLEAPF